MGEAIMEKLPEFVPLSKFNRGYAGQILSDVKENNKITVVVKNNEPEAVIISVERYNQLASTSFENKLANLPKITKEHRSAGGLQKYAKPDYVGKEKDLYRQRLNEKYGKTNSR